jgi:hypothetical protein
VKDIIIMCVCVCVCVQVPWWTRGSISNGWWWCFLFVLAETTTNDGAGERQRAEYAHETTFRLTKSLT